MRSRGRKRIIPGIKAMHLVSASDTATSKSMSPHRRRKAHLASPKLHARQPAASVPTSRKEILALEIPPFKDDRNIIKLEFRPSRMTNVSHMRTRNHTSFPVSPILSHFSLVIFERRNSNVLNFSRDQAPPAAWLHVCLPACQPT